MQEILKKFNMLQAVNILKIAGHIIVVSMYHNVNC